MKTFQEQEKLLVSQKKSLNKPLYSIIELAAEISLDPSSNILRLFIKPPGNEPGPDGDGKWRDEGPIPGDGARRGGVARPRPESVSV